MDVLTMVVLIVTVCCAAGAYDNYLKSKRKAKADAPDTDLLDEIDALRERVEVLEKIVTDERYHLSRELNDLERSA